MKNRVLNLSFFKSISASRRVTLAVAVFCALVLATVATGQESSGLTPIQREIERQRQRLASTEVEDRRDALMRLATLKRAEASRAAASALSDKIPIVRATAAHAIIWLRRDEAVTLLIPLLKDKTEIVRREAASALGETEHSSAVAMLLEVMVRDKESSVRAAAAIALGQIGEDTAVAGLSQIITGDTSKKKKTKDEKEEFVVRSAVRSLGQIGDRTAVPVLIAALQDESNSIDTRREAAAALGLIGDVAALPALEAAFRLNADPYLSDAARIAIRQINRKAKGAGS